MESNWITLQTGESLPQHVAQAGETKDGSPILVGRAWHDNELLPATVVPSQSCAYVSRNAREYVKTKYEIFVAEGCYWQASEYGYVPANAVRFINQKRPEEMLIGRVKYKDAMCVGRVYPAQQSIYFPYKGVEVCQSTYEVLAVDNSENWLPTSFHFTPADAVEGGHDTDDATIYVGRALLGGQWLPAKVIPSKTCAYVSYEGCEVFVREYQILRGHGYIWHKVYGHFIPINAVMSGISGNGEPLYIGRGHFNGSMTPGVISTRTKSLTLPYGGMAISVLDYEVLIKS